MDVRQKVAEGADWRGTIRVSIGGEEKELTVRQLTDKEFFRVMKKIDRDELQALRSELPEGEMERYRELQQKEELDEDEQEEFENLEADLEESAPDMFDKMSERTFEGIQEVAKLAVVPDEEDKREALYERAPEIEKEYGIKVSGPEDVAQALNDDIAEMIEQSTDFTSFTIGIQALVQTVGEEGN